MVRSSHVASRLSHVVRSIDQERGRLAWEGAEGRLQAVRGAGAADQTLVLGRLTSPHAVIASLRPQRTDAGRRCCLAGAVGWRLIGTTGDEGLPDRKCARSIEARPARLTNAMVCAGLLGCSLECCARRWPHLGSILLPKRKVLSGRNHSLPRPVVRCTCRAFES